LAEKPFAKCVSKSIDYVVMEHTEKAAVVPADIGWNDVGSWTSLWEDGAKDGSDNVLVGDVVALDSARSYLRSEEERAAEGIHPWYKTPAQMQAELINMAEHGVNTLNLYDGTPEPTNGGWDFARLDQCLAMAKRAGLTRSPFTWLGHNLYFIPYTRGDRPGVQRAKHILCESAGAGTHLQDHGIPQMNQHSGDLRGDALTQDAGQFRRSHKVAPCTELATPVVVIAEPRLIQRVTHVPFETHPTIIGIECPTNSLAQSTRDVESELIGLGKGRRHRIVLVRESRVVKCAG